MFAQEVALLGDGAEPPPDSSEPRRNCVICALVTASRSAWVIWPSFSSRLIRDSRSFTRVATGRLGSWYGRTAAPAEPVRSHTPTTVEAIRTRTVPARNSVRTLRRTGLPFSSPRWWSRCRRRAALLADRYQPGSTTVNIPNYERGGGSPSGSPADSDEQVLGVCVGDEGGLAGNVVIGKAVGEVVDGVVVPEPGVVVCRGRLVVQGGVRPL